MSVIKRGVKNAFRSGVRTAAIVLILAVSMGLGLSMLLANQAMNDKIETVKKSVGTTVAVNPAGIRGFQGGGDPLTTDDLAKLKNIPHITSINSVLHLSAQTEGAEGGAFAIFGGGQKTGKTNLESSEKPGIMGQRIETRGAVGFSAHAEAGGAFNSAEPVQIDPASIKLPVRFEGISGALDENGQAIKVTSGRTFAGDDKNAAVVGKTLAEHNKLGKGSTFKLYDETFTVVGIFDNGTEFGNDMAYIPLATAQRISEAGKEISNAVVRVDSVDNLTTTATAISSTLGANKADVTVTEENAITAVESLRTVARVSLIGFVIALGAAAVIIFLAMLMIVRDRRREIGVLKAIGGGNRSIVAQFVTEAMVLVMMSAVLGVGVAALSSNGIAGALVKSNSGEQTSSPYETPLQGGGPSRATFHTFSFNGGSAASLKSAKDLVGNVTTNIGWTALAYGVLAALVIAIIGSALPAWLVTKVRPSEVLRGE